MGSRRMMETRGVDPAQQSLAGAFQVSLRDRLGNEMRVQIFHICFEVGGDCHHLIGLAESGEGKCLRGLASDGSPQETERGRSGSYAPGPPDMPSVLQTAERLALAASMRERRQRRRRARAASFGSPFHGAEGQLEATTVGRIYIIYIYIYIHVYTYIYIYIYIYIHNHI